VTATAGAPAWRPRGSRTSFLVAAAFLCWAAPSRAEVGATASIYSDLRFRGYSLSEGRPVGIFDFAYDDPSGLYVGASAIGVLRSGGDPAPLGFQLTGGYARRLESGTTLDFGITHSNYSHYSGGGRGSSYTELYAGITRGHLSSRIYLSPHYFERGRWSAYAEVNGSLSPARKWSIDGHVGMHVPLRTPSNQRYRAEVDWRLGVSRELGRLSLHAAWSDGTPGYDFYRGRRHSRSALVLGATWIL
jgi:uncharacterized protein (TIGR02001 family)